LSRDSSSRELLVEESDGVSIASSYDDDDEDDEDDLLLQTAAAPRRATVRVMSKATREGDFIVTARAVGMVVQ
jgi:hypothetical protein